MPTLTPQLVTLLSTSFGYLSGNDLVSWCNPELLISRQNIQPRALQDGCDTAVAEIQSKLQNIYDLTSEFKKTDVLQALAASVITGGAISGITLTVPGSGYTDAPVVTVSRGIGDNTGIDGAVTAIVSDSVVSAIELLNQGGRYLTAPAVTITGGGGAGATASCTIDNFGHVQTLTLLTGGSGYTSVPQVLFSGGGGLAASAVASVTFGTVTGFTVTNAGSLYTAPPILSVALPSTADPRAAKIVKLCAIFAVRNIMGSAANVSDWMKAYFMEADNSILNIISGLENLPAYAAIKQLRSDLQIVNDRFHQIG